MQPPWQRSLPAGAALRPGPLQPGAFRPPFSWAQANAAPWLLRPAAPAAATPRAAAAAAAATPRAPVVVPRTVTPRAPVVVPARPPAEGSAAACPEPESAAPFEWVSCNGGQLWVLALHEDPEVEAAHFPHAKGTCANLLLGGEGVKDHICEDGPDVALDGSWREKFSSVGYCFAKIRSGRFEGVRAVARYKNGRDGLRSVALALLLAAGAKHQDVIDSAGIYDAELPALMRRARQAARGEGLAVKAEQSDSPPDACNSSVAAAVADSQPTVEPKTEAEDEPAGAVEEQRQAVEEQRQPRRQGHTQPLRTRSRRRQPRSSAVSTPRGASSSSTAPGKATPSSLARSGATPGSAAPRSSLPLNSRTLEELTREQRVRALAEGLPDWEEEEEEEGESPNATAPMSAAAASEADIDGLQDAQELEASSAWVEAEAELRAELAAARSEAREARAATELQLEQQENRHTAECAGLLTELGELRAHREEEHDASLQLRLELREAQSSHADSSARLRDDLRRAEVSAQLAEQKEKQTARLQRAAATRVADVLQRCRQEESSAQRSQQGEAEALAQSEELSAALRRAEGAAAAQRPCGATLLLGEERAALASSLATLDAVHWKELRSRPRIADSHAEIPGCEHVLIAASEFAKSLAQLQALKVRYLLCVDDTPSTLAGKLYRGVGIKEHKILRLEDSPTHNVLEQLQAAHLFMDRAQGEHCKVLVHSAGGVNRAGAVVLSYMVRRSHQKGPRRPSWGQEVLQRQLASLASVWWPVLQQASFRLQLLLWCHCDFEAQRAREHPLWAPLLFRCLTAERIRARRQLGKTEEEVRAKLEMLVDLVMFKEARLQKPFALDTPEERDNSNMRLQQFLSQKYS